MIKILVVWIAALTIVDVADCISRAVSDYAKYKYGTKKQTI